MTQHPPYARLNFISLDEGGGEVYQYSLGVVKTTIPHLIGVPYPPSSLPRLYEGVADDFFLLSCSWLRTHGVLPIKLL